MGFMNRSCKATPVSEMSVNISNGFAMPVKDLTPGWERAGGIPTDAPKLYPTTWIAFHVPWYPCRWRNSLDIKSITEVTCAISPVPLSCVPSDAPTPLKLKRMAQKPPSLQALKMQSMTLLCILPPNSGCGCKRTTRESVLLAGVNSHSNAQHVPIDDLYGITKAFFIVYRIGPSGKKIGRLRRW